VMKTTLAHTGDRLDTIPAVALCGGPALYLFSYVALRLRVSRSAGRGRLVAAFACALVVPVAVAVPALVALALVPLAPPGVPVLVASTTALIGLRRRVA